jgi:hypothetical protein
MHARDQHPVDEARDQRDEQGENHADQHRQRISIPPLTKSRMVRAQITDANPTRPADAQVDAGGDDDVGLPDCHQRDQRAGHQDVRKVVDAEKAAPSRGEEDDQQQQK